MPRNRFTETILSSVDLNNSSVNAQVTGCTHPPRARLTQVYLGGHTRLVATGVERLHLKAAHSVDRHQEAIVEQSVEIERVRRQRTVLVVGGLLVIRLLVIRLLVRDLVRHF